MNDILKALDEQRWDDHRYYHHSRINQSLHLVSALSFLCAYVLLFMQPALAGLVGWVVSMGTRQAGHFFFEPKGYDIVNGATHEYKEEIKVGYNLRRKLVLIAVWAASPLLVVLDPTLLGVFEPVTGIGGVIERTGLVWLAIGAGGLVFRTLHLCLVRDARTGLVWALKILTDPINDVRQYWQAPFALMRGELIDSTLAAQVARRGA